MTFKNWLFNILYAVIMLPLSMVVFMPFIVLGYLFYFNLIILSVLYPPFSNMLKDHTLNMSISIDQFANASIFGNPDQTVSGRLGYAIHYQNKNNVIYVTLCKFLNIFFSQKNHCLEAIEYDRID